MIKEIIESKLTEALNPIHMDVINESFMHNVPPGSESHFKVIVVSNEFENKRLIARHRLVNQTLANELENGVHALSMHTYTPSEWQDSAVVPESPMCKGGSKLNP
ncbi:BolA/IbaG family iron-sulfur metabolism protein [Vibrio sp.]|uniref:DNA-binding transcriptional regulator BolA n=1 Tax=Vibrio viridaestus TaxID=2487322 RepID=A0A3N9THZ9_9VIBR|nr:BolA/IbaG family iron-sulfur metabolism protein [Vibrio viridaestus]MDC0609929.1 BolA/IbaG family iron-sulfur metabolism protein [Vibrio sp.]RQW63907.1 BolA/IbaG family iron-sulfur metabolism protein [Vibrio viridaestus]